MSGIHSCDALIESRLDDAGNFDGTQAELDELVNRDGGVFDTFFGSTVGQKFLQTYVWDDAAWERIRDLYFQRFGNYPVLCRNIEQVVGDLLLIGDPRLNPANVPEPGAPEPAQLKKARENRQLRQEIESDLETFGGISSRAIEQKKANRPEYRAKWDEMRTPQITKDDLPEYSQELNDFATAYNSASAASLKMQGGVYRVGGVPFGADKFNRLLEQASALKLIRG